MTLQSARQRLEVNNKNQTTSNFELLERLRAIREELVGMRDALNAFSYEQVEALKEQLPE